MSSWTQINVRGPADMLDDDNVRVYSPDPHHHQHPEDDESCSAKQSVVGAFDNVVLQASVFTSVST